MLAKAGIEVELGVGARGGARSLAGFLTRSRSAAAHHAQAGLSIDGKIALPSGESKWITGEDARAHVHLERAHSDMILVGRGTYLADRQARRAPARARTGRRAARC
jgi:diaminohydroxyphosphoribosylaminopyrimidine deaminase/5-amino-6-(5-phosphoribosylamino)uracil reductase